MRRTTLGGGLRRIAREIVEAHGFPRGIAGLVDDADMRRDDPPALGKAHPGLHLPSHLARQRVAMEQRRGHGHVAAIGRDDRPRGRAPQPDRRARGAEGRDLAVAVKVLADAVAHRARIVAEELRARRRRSTPAPARSAGTAPSPRPPRREGRCPSKPPRRRRHDHAHPLQRMGDAQRDVLAPGRRDDLHADRQSASAARAPRPPAGR